MFTTSTGTALDAANVRRVGHAGAAVTEAVYREELRPVLVDGAAMIGSILRRRGAPNRVRLPVWLPDLARDHLGELPLPCQEEVSRGREGSEGPARHP